MIEGIDTVHVSDTALRRTATQLKDHCEVKGWVDKLPRMPSMAAHLCVTLRLGNGTSIVVQNYSKNITECEDEVSYLIASLCTVRKGGGWYSVIPYTDRITDITNALRSGK